jgi:hypothetical protein
MLALIATVGILASVTCVNDPHVYEGVCQHSVSPVLPANPDACFTMEDQAYTVAILAAAYARIAGIPISAIAFGMASSGTREESVRNWKLLLKKYNVPPLENLWVN